MAAKKQDRHLKKALAHFGYQSETMLTESDLKVEISLHKSNIQELKDTITTAQEKLKERQEYLDLLEDVHRQIEVEIYKELNPMAEVFPVY